MKEVALITGASAGIGKEFARIHAAKGRDMVLVARREKELNALKSEIEKEFSVQVKVIAKDLSQASAPKEIYDALKADGIAIEYLLNNAGFGGHGFFHEREWAKDEAMIAVNITALSALTRLFLPDMVARKSGKVLNVASTAGMLPGPLQAVYYATKAFVGAFSQAGDEEVRSHGGTVTALCPGPVETEFVQMADMEGVSLFKSKGGGNSAEACAKTGYKGMEKGKLIQYDNAFLGFQLDWIVPLSPRRMVLKLSRSMMEKS